LGVETKFKIGSENTRVVTFGDGDQEPAFGAQGGKCGTLNTIKLIYPDKREYLTTTKDLVEGVEKGTIFFQQAGGGGGYGEPFLRPEAKVLKDVRNGVLSQAQARTDYGVAIDIENMTIDEAETAKLRSKGDN
jgi:N-methylhydantoinase B